VIVTFIRLILPVLVDPDRKQPVAETGHTLDEYTAEPQAETPRDTDRGDVRPG